MTMPFPRRSPVRSRRAATPLAALCATLAAVLLSACGSGETATGPGGDTQPVCGAVGPDGGGGVEAPPDGASLCAAGPCNYQTQDGCPSSQSCRPLYPAGSTTISVGCEATGAGASGDSCTNSTDCARGYVCVGESQSVFKCHKMCCGGDWSACDAGESCIRQWEIEFPDKHREYAVDLCFPVGTCDVFDATSCASDPTRECKIVDPTGAVACAPKSSATLGEPCGPPAVCAQGFTCVGPVGGQRTCRRLCVPEACAEPACPTAEGTCVHFDRDPPGVGECTTTGR